MAKKFFIDGDYDTKSITRNHNTYNRFAHKGYESIIKKLETVSDSLEKLEDNDLLLYFIRSKIKPIANSEYDIFYNIDDIIKAIKSENIDDFVENNETDNENDLRDDINHRMTAVEIKGKIVSFSSFKSTLLDNYVKHVEEWGDKEYTYHYGYYGVSAKNAIKRMKPAQKETLLSGIENYIMNEVSGPFITEKLMFFKIAEMYEEGGKYRELFKVTTKKSEKAKYDTLIKNGSDLAKLFPEGRSGVPVGPQNERSGSGKIAAIEVNGKTFKLDMTTEETDDYYNIYGDGEESELYNEEDAYVTYAITASYNGKEIEDAFDYNPATDKDTYNKLYKDIIDMIKGANDLNESKTPKITTIYDKFLL